MKFQFPCALIFTYAHNAQVALSWGSSSPALSPSVSRFPSYRTMAKTKKTAWKITGGKAPRNALWLAAARQTCYPRDQLMYEFSSRSNIEKVLRTPASEVRNANFHIWIRRPSRPYSDTAQQFEQPLVHDIKDYLVRRPNVEVICDDACRLGLTESIGDSNRYRNFHDDEWDIEDITLNRDETYYGVDASAKQSHRILLYTLNIMGSGESSEHRVDEGLFQFGGLDRVLAYMAVDLFCSRNLGRACNMLHGWGRRSNSLTRTFRSPSFWYCVVP